MHRAFRQVFTSSALFVTGLSGCAHQKNAFDKRSCVIGEPVYPLEAKRKGEAGRVSVQMTADRDGKIIGANVIKSSASASLDNAALKSAGQTLCQLLYVDGERVAFEFSVPYTFSLGVNPPKNGVSIPD